MFAWAAVKLFDVGPALRAGVAHLLQLADAERAVDTVENIAAAAAAADSAAAAAAAAAAWGRGRRERHDQRVDRLLPETSWPPQLRIFHSQRARLAAAAASTGGARGDAVGHTRLEAARIHGRVSDEGSNSTSNALRPIHTPGDTGAFERGVTGYAEAGVERGGSVATADHRKDDETRRHV
eukprot:SAG11_NODE_7415_length_1147_cov_1.447519_1_plen_181_part_00